MCLTISDGYNLLFVTQAPYSCQESDFNAMRHLKPSIFSILISSLLDLKVFAGKNNRAFVNRESIQFELFAGSIILYFVYHVHF